MNTDADLVERWRTGDREAGSELVERHYRAVGRFFRNKVCNAEDATDLVSQTFLACTSACHRFRGQVSFQVFLFAIARNVLRTYIRKRAKRVLEEADFESICVAKLPGATLSSILMHGREAQAFVDALRNIPVSDQILLEQVYFEGESAASLAANLGVPAVTVRGQLMRARERLREQVQQRLAVSLAIAIQPTYENLEEWAREVRTRGQ